MDNRLNFKHMISLITFTGCNWTAHKIKCVLNTFVDESPSLLEELRLGPSEPSMIPVTKDHKSFSIFCKTEELWNFAHTAPGSIACHS